MKYSKSNPPLVCMQTNSTCYKGTSKMTVKGVLWHSTGANNKTIKRYVQPSENDPNYSELMAKIGKNPNKNDWNHVSTQAGLNAWIGTLADGTVATVQTMPWDYKPWGCGSGTKGSCNQGFVQFECCEDNLSDPNYFAKVYAEACELTAYICSLYNLNPKGSVNVNGVAVPVILCHQDSYKLGLGSNHSDVYNWFNRYGKTMNDVRNDVAALLAGSGISVTTPASGDTMPETSPGDCLGKGDYSKAVQKLQENLIKLGYSCGPKGADGDFGSSTDAAVHKFQADHNLKVDGLVGPATETAIQEALKRQASGTPTGDNLYRVRKNWDDPKSQIGAFRIIEYAKEACDKAGKDYKVFDSVGHVIYPLTIKDPVTVTPEPAPKPQKPATTYTGVMLGYASKDENSRYSGGTAGDQTGGEVKISAWYDGGWDVILRPTDDALAEAIAAQCEDACNNPHIGYDQGQRNTIYTEAKRVGLKLGKITTDCECDCSSLVSVCCIAAGLAAGPFYDGNLRVTSNLEKACAATGKFTSLRDTKYLRKKEYLKRGDIVLNSKSHAAVCLADGSLAESRVGVVVQQPTPDNFLARVTANTLNVRSEPNDTSIIVTTVKKGDVFTIVGISGRWGKLKSGAGWICLTYTEKV